MFLIFFFMLNYLCILFFFQLLLQKISIILFLSHSLFIISVLNFEKLLTSIVIVFNKVFFFTVFLLKIISEFWSWSIWIVHVKIWIIELRETWWFLKVILLWILNGLRVVSNSWHTHGTYRVHHFIVDGLVLIFDFFVVMFFHGFLQLIFEQSSVCIFIICSRVFINLEFLEQLRFNLFS